MAPVVCLSSISNNSGLEKCAAECCEERWAGERSSILTLLIVRWIHHIWRRHLLYLWGERIYACGQVPQFPISDVEFIQMPTYNGGSLDFILQSENASRHAFNKENAGRPTLRKFVYSSQYWCRNWGTLAGAGLRGEWRPEMVSGHGLCITSTPQTASDRQQQIISLPAFIIVSHVPVLRCSKTVLQWTVAERKWVMLDV